jgi:transcriptional regulator with XRE-family HTH domain
MTDMDAAPSFGTTLRTLRTMRGWSLRDLGERITFHRAYVGKVEQGEKFPLRQFAKLADKELGASGILLSVWEREHEQRQAASATGQLLTASVADSLRLIQAEGDSGIDELHEEGAHLAVAYLGEAPSAMLREAVKVRAQIFARLSRHDYRPSELADLYAALGLVQGVLSYAALDLGHSSAAMTHAEAAWACAQRIESNELRAWVRGTQSLISRFDSRYEDAEELARDGLRYPARGTGRLRLLSGVAQCRANLGDSVEANRLLDEAARERESLSSTDTVEGLFGFSEAKQHYYAGSSLMWLPSSPDLQRAAEEAELAVAMWEEAPSESRSLDDEALAHIYAATAHMRLGALDAARAAILPVLQLPPERHISWIVKRLRGLAEALEADYVGSSEAADLSDEIREVSG